MKFDVSDLAFDAVLFILEKFICKIDFNELILQHFQTNDNTIRFHKYADNLLQKIYHKIANGTSSHKY